MCVLYQKDDDIQLSAKKRPYMNKGMKLFSHQEVEKRAIINKKEVMLASDCGTGKTISLLSAIIELIDTNKIEGALIFAPKSVVMTAYPSDYETFYSESNVCLTIAIGAKRLACVKPKGIVITNHATAMWLIKNNHLPDMVKHVKSHKTLICIDEARKASNPKTYLAEMMKKIAPETEYRVMMTGTLYSGGVIGAFMPFLFTDLGEALGKSWFRFRMYTHYNATEEAKDDRNPNAPAYAKWVEREHAKEAILGATAHLTVRHTLDDCHDIPKQTISWKPVKLPPKAMKAYKRLKNQHVLETESGIITAKNAGGIYQKLRGYLVGAPLDEEQIPIAVQNQRYDALLEDMIQTDNAIAFYEGQFEPFKKRIKAKKIKNYGVINGSTSGIARKTLVSKFQAGKLPYLFLHILSGAHGITLSYTQYSFFLCPPLSAEDFIQALARTRRAGQKSKTYARLYYTPGTIDDKVRLTLEERVEGSEMANELMASNTNNK
jgi:superfamily II DNA or RNA helicase